VPVRLIHREKGVGGLSGAVIEGIKASTSDWCLVMDGDLQHPPEMIPVLIETGDTTGADVVVASRHVKGGSNEGLNGLGRKLVSNGSTIATKAMFPISLRNVTDPMTGFFAVRRASVDIDTLKPRGFKILLEILSRGKLKVAEEPFIFGERFAGESKANFMQGIRFMMQLASLRFGRLSAFAVIGAIGAVANIAIMAALVSGGANYIAAAIAAAVITITANFFLQEHFVFKDLTGEGKRFSTRFAQSVGFNGAEAAIRLPILFVIVDVWMVNSVLAQAVTLVAAFVFRFIYHSRIVYRPKRTVPSSPLVTEATAVELTLDKPAIEGL
jgi:dolichol-phosphate mannosyltransferase